MLCCTIIDPKYSMFQERNNRWIFPGDSIFQKTLFFGFLSCLRTLYVALSGGWASTNPNLREPSPTSPQQW